MKGRLPIACGYAKDCVAGRVERRKTQTNRGGKSGGASPLNELKLKLRTKGVDEIG